MRIKITFILLILIKNLELYSQTNFPDIRFTKAYYEIDSMLSGKKPMNFESAVYLTENAYYGGRVDYQRFTEVIDTEVEIIKSYMKSNQLLYDGNDYKNVSINSAIFRLMTDTIWLTDSEPIHYPFLYNLEDLSNEISWENSLVTHLLETDKGNCHSLPYLFKILSERLGSEAYIALAPNHMYIKCWSERTGWYNIELTNAMFPIDAWIAASGYVQLEAIQNGIFMDTLGLKRSIAYCMFDLAKASQKRYGFKTFPFMFACLDKAMEYYPNFINAMLFKASLLKQRLDLYKTLYNTNNYDDLMHLETPKEIVADMEALYVKALELGYREMPPKMYQEWLVSLKNSELKYQNTKIKFIFKQN